MKPSRKPAALNRRSPASGGSVSVSKLKPLIEDSEAWAKEYIKREERSRATIGEFTDSRGKVRQCLSLGVLKDGRCKGLLKIRYSRNGQAVVGYILPHEFRADARQREQERLRHMEAHSNDIYGKSPND